MPLRFGKRLLRPRQRTEGVLLVLVELASLSIARILGPGEPDLADPLLFSEFRELFLGAAEAGEVVGMLVRADDDVEATLGNREDVVDDLVDGGRAALDRGMDAAIDHHPERLAVILGEFQ